MKKTLLSIATLALLLSGCVQTQPTASSKVTTSSYTIDKIKPSADEDAEGAIDKDFFVKEILTKKPSNVTIIDVRTDFEYNAGHFEGAKRIPVADIYAKGGCEKVIAQLPKEGYVVAVCATGARAGEMWAGLKDTCKYPVANKVYYLDNNVMYNPKGGTVK